MANDFTNMVFDPATGQTKRKTLPYLNPNETSQGYLPYVGDQQNATPGSLAQGNSNVMGAAQQTALSPQQSKPIQDQTTQMTQKLMTDPNMGRDWQKYNAGAMSKFDVDRASGIQQFKESNAGMGGAGQVDDNLIKLALQQNVDRGTLENDLENQAYQEGMKNYIQALGQGREQGQYLDQSQQDALDNILKVRSAYEGERSQTQQIASTEKLAADQNYLQQQGIDLQKAGMYGYTGADGQHVYGSAEIAAQKLGLESKDLQNQTTELFGGMVDTNGDGVPDKQIFGKYDALNNEDKRAADELYGYDVKDSIGNVVGHVNGSLQLQNDKADIEKQGLDMDKAKIYGYDKADGTHIDGELDAAMKQQGIDLERLGIDKNTAYGYAQTDANGNPVLDANGQPVRVKGALEMQVEKLGVDKMLAELEAKKVNTEEIESTYNFITNEIDAGRASPNSAIDYLNGQLSKNGVSLTTADKDAIYGEIAQDFKVQQYQYALSNPSMAQYDNAGKFIGLTDAGNKAFGNYVSTTLYGKQPATGGVDVTGYKLENGKVTDSTGKEITPDNLSVALRNADDPTNQNNQIYSQMASTAKTLSPRINKASNNTLSLDGASKGDVVNAGGRLMIITNGPIWSTSGRNHDEFEIMDVATGTKKLFTGLTSTDNSVLNFDSWVTSLTA